jgi:Protein of unknown function (DUF3617)
MKMRVALTTAFPLAALLLLASCSDNSDTDGNGKITREERAKEMAEDGYLAMQPGRWKTEFKFTDIDVPRLGKKEREDLMKEAAGGASGVSCLSEADAAKPGADFFGGQGAEDCQYSKFDLAGNRANMALSCGMGGMGKAAMELDGTVGETSFVFDTKLSIDVPIVGKIKLAGNMIGTHQGKCQGNE